MKLATETIVVQPPNIKTLNVEIEGTASMIQHRFSEKAKRQILEKQMKKAAKKKEARKPEKDFEAAKYLNKNKEIAFPALCIKQAIVGAARNVDGLPMTVLRGAVFVRGDEDGLIKVAHKECLMREDVVRLNGAGADLRFRPELREWSMKLRIELNADVLSAEQVINLLSIAGFSQGLGEWRPEKNGDFGTFRVREG
jgi:hypothetical protein